MTNKTEKNNSEQVKIKVDVTKVQDGREYKGNISFDGHDFQYHLRFGVHLREFNEIAQRNPPPTYEDITSLIQFTVKDAHGKLVTLDKSSFPLFLSTAGKLAMDFYDNPQTRESQEGILGMAVSRMGALADMGISVSIGMSTEYDRPRIPQLNEFLEKYQSRTGEKK
jgi:hypothetical protein